MIRVKVVKNDKPRTLTGTKGQGRSLTTYNRVNHNRPAQSKTRHEKWLLHP